MVTEMSRTSQIGKLMRTSMLTAAMALPLPALAQGGAPAGADDQAAEIVVTAQKREERLLAVPAPVTVLSAASLSQTNQTQIQDFYARVPGLSMTNAGYNGGAIVSIRGISSGLFNDGTTGVVIDDVPFGNSSATGPTEIVPEIDPADLARLEVLRGPQGTLYGASSMGGLLKYVTVAPVLGRMSGMVRGGISGVKNGGEAGYDFYGALNLPLGDTAAVRMSGYTRKIAGFIDDPLRNREDVNEGRVSGARAAFLWSPTESFSAKFSALYQKTDFAGADYVVAIPGLGVTARDLKQNSPPGTGGTEREIQFYTLTLTGQMGAAQITSLTGYSRNNTTFVGDYSPLYGGLANTLFPGFAGVRNVLGYETERFSQELRLDMPLGESIDVLLGGFYNFEDVPAGQQLYAVDTTSGAQGGVLGTLDFPSEFKEYAVFGQATVKLVERFEVQLGGRYSANRQELTQVNSGLLFGGTTAIPTIRSEGDAFTYLVSPKFTVSPDLMIYARIASGYRPGGPNTNALGGVNPSWEADTTSNYEVGAKGRLFDRMLTFDLSFYHISWNDLVITLINQNITPMLSYKDNVGKAKSEGIELSLELRPGAGLTIAAAGALSRAELTEDFPPTASASAKGRKGDWLPFSSRFNGSVSVDQDLRLGDWTGFWGATVSHVGKRRGPFTGTAGVREVFDAYSKLDLRLGARRDDWTFNLYMNNATDSRGRLNGGIGAFIPAFNNFIPPRTYGVSVQKAF